jgi:hypothetical protein
VFEPAQEAGERARVVAQVVGPHRRAEGLVRGAVAVGIDHERAHLRAQAANGMQRQRLAMEGLQALVDAAHARAASAGQHQARDVGRRDGVRRHGGRRRHPPM